MLRVGTMFLPNNITFLRKQRKMTQQQLADFFGYTFAAISYWEKGSRTPDALDLYRLSKIFEVSADDLVKVDLEAEHYNIKKYTKKEVKEKVAQIVSNSELEDNKKQMIINVTDVACEEFEGR
jgi:transcriptional regulator with XRE-family HTH domain